MVETSKECWLSKTCEHYKEGICSCSVFCHKRIRLELMYDKSFLTEKQRNVIGLQPDGGDEELFARLNDLSNNIEDFVERGGNAFLYSTTSGNGKTSWAIRLIQSYFNKTWHIASVVKPTALFINVPAYFPALKSSFSDEDEYISSIKQNYRNVDLVVWDDIATKSLTDFETDMLLGMISQRIDNGKANIYTSNVDLEGKGKKLEALLGTRLTSRIASIPEEYKFKFVGFDKRDLK